MQVETERRDARRYLTRLIIFVAPVLLLFTPPLAVLQLGGEVAGLDVEQVVVDQRESSGRRETLYGLAYSECAVSYKRASLAIRTPEVLVLGTSRVLQFRSEFFRDPSVVYNAGRAIRRLRHLQQFLDAVPESAWPRLLILGLDQNFFNPAWDAGGDDIYRRELRGCGDTLELLQRSWRSIYGDFTAGKLPIDELVTSDIGRIGLTARLRNGGFRADGSYQYDAERIDRYASGHPHFEFADTMARIAGRRSRFKPAVRTSGHSASTLRALGDRLAAAGVHVVAFLPPFPPSVVEALSATGDYGYLTQLPSVVREALPAATFVDYTDISDWGATDDDDVDGIHCSERTYSRLLGDLARRDVRLGAHVDVPHLVRIIARGEHPMLVLPRDD